jgi:hypothetical protein
VPLSARLTCLRRVQHKFRQHADFPSMWRASGERNPVPTDNPSGDSRFKMLSLDVATNAVGARHHVVGQLP